ncbi:MAG: hypothetical protein ACYCWE_19300 [Eubacteriales bacterium]
MFNSNGHSVHSWRHLHNIDNYLDDYFEVDDMIAPVIQLLNKKGYVTTFYCGGHPYVDICEFSTDIESNSNMWIYGVAGVFNFKQKEHGYMHYFYCEHLSSITYVSFIEDYGIVQTYLCL